MKQLLEWTNNYLKNRDLSLRKIVALKIDEKSGVIDVKFKDKQVMHHITDQLSDKLSAITAGNHVIVCLNTKENFSYLIKNWNKISKNKNLSIIFVNLEHNDKWLINPYVHSMIADPESLETGLQAMFDAANGDITEPKPQKKKPQIFDEDVANEDESET